MKINRFSWKAVVAATIVTTALLSGGCEKYDEEPPWNQEFDTEFILPTPTELTNEEYNYYQSLLNEYNQSVPQQ